MSAAPSADPARSGWQAAWGAIPRRDRRFYGAVLAGCLALLGGWLSWRAVDAEVRVSARFWSRWSPTPSHNAQTWPPVGGSSDARDPWGRPLIRAELPHAPIGVVVAYSSGLNGVDDGGGGDDILVLPHDHPRLVAFQLLPLAAVALALLLALGWELHRFLRRPRLPLRTELWASALAAAPIGAALSASLVFALQRGWLPASLRQEVERRLLTSLEVSLALWGGAAAFGLILWVRLRGESDEEAAA